MKMRLSAFLAFAMLSISILSYGVNGSVFAEEHNIPPLYVSTDLEVYANGSDVVISGNIKNYDSSSGHGLTFIIISPDNNIVTIGQLTPSSDGSFQYSFVAGGPLWKSSGDYNVEFNYGSISGEATINYVGGVLNVTPTTCASNETLINGVCIEKEPEPIVTCASNETLINGVCIEKEPEPIVTCASNETLINGVCIEKEPEQPTCGAGTELVNGICQVIKTQPPPDSGCLIATAAYGTELAPQVQFLREIRDNTLFSTTSGTTFMTGFNTLYYSFAPTVADWERESPLFKEAVRAFITPMISTLSIMALADNGSEAEVLGLGISVIALNLGMYIAAPALIGFKVHKHIKSRM